MLLLINVIPFLFDIAENMIKLSRVNRHSNWSASSIDAEAIESTLKLTNPRYPVKGRLFLRPDNDNSLQDSSPEGFSNEQGTDRSRFCDPYCVFVTNPTTRTLLPISNHQSETDVRPSTGISDTSGVSQTYTCLI